MSNGDQIQGEDGDAPHAGRRVRRWPRRLLAGGGGLVGVVVLVGLTPLRGPVSAALSRVIFVAASPWTPKVANLSQLPASSRFVAADGSDLGEVDPSLQRDLVHLKDLPPVVPHAVLAAEDADFYHHHGVSPAALLRAAFHSASGQTQGGSTLTQQLAKLNYTGSRRTLGRKLRELLYAEKLERTYSKDRLLERYLNQVYFGEGAYGIGAASRTYFGIPAGQLDPAQAAMLAGKIRAPNLLDPRVRPDAVKLRRNQVLNSMASHKWITGQQRDAAAAGPIVVVPPISGRQGYASFFLSYVEREAAGLDALGSSAEARTAALHSGGLTIRTTLDRRAYDSAAAAVQANLGQPGDPTGVVVSVVPGDGAVRDLFGGLDSGRQFDVASQGQRQPGSAFKPFTYLAMLAAGIDPRTPYPTASPVTVNCPEGPYTVKNYDGEDAPAPQVDVDTALAHSINTVFAQLVAKVGPPSVLTQAETAGVHKGIHPGCAVGLGGLDHGVSPLEMAAAYATFAARGTYAAPYSIAEVDDASGHPVYKHQPATRPAFDANQVGVLTGALERVVTEGTGVAASIGRPVAGKTGTTEHYGDAWFVGFVPQLATAVWVGHPDAEVSMDNVHGIAVAGGTYPARIFAAAMREALNGVPVQPLVTVSPDVLHLHLDTTTTSTTTTSTSAPTSTTTTTTPSHPPKPGPTTTVASSPPPAPAGLTADTARKGPGVALHWQASAGATSYRIYRGTSSGQETLLADTGSNATSFDDTATASGAVYYYRVTAVDQAGESAPSNEAKATAR